MNARTQRPRRERKGDRLLNPGSSKAQIECDYGIAPLDRLASEYDMKWGIDRLPELVTPELAARYGAAMAYLNECIDAQDPAKCVDAAGNCIRGLHAMDAEATRLGRTPATGDFWEFDMEGFKFAILRDGVEWQTAKDARPDLKFYTLREVGVALKALSLDHPMFAEIKKTYPKAEISGIRERTPLETALNDSIPF